MQLAISRQSDRQTIASAAIIHICHSFTSQRLTTRTAQIVATEMFCCSVMIISYFVQLLLLAYLFCMHFIILCVLVVNCCAIAYVCVFVIFIWNAFAAKEMHSFPLCCAGITAATITTINGCQVAATNWKAISSRSVDACCGCSIFHFNLFCLQFLLLFLLLLLLLCMFLSLSCHKCHARFD